MAYRDSSATINASGTSINATKPAGLQTGDILLCYLLTDVGLNAPAPTVTAPTGWTFITGSNQGTNSGAPDGFTSFVYWKVASPGEPATYTFSLTGGATQIIALIGCWSGRKKNPVFNSSNTHGTVNTTGNATPVTVSDTGLTPRANDDVVIFATGDITVGTDTWSFTAVPSNYTERQDSQTTFNVGTMDSRDAVLAGATGTLSLTLTRSAGTGTSGWGIFVVAIPDEDISPLVAARPIWMFPKRFDGSNNQPWLHKTIVPTSAANQNTIVTPDVGSLVIDGFSPQVNLQINVDVGSLVITGFAPQVSEKINTGVGSLLLTGFAPTVSVSNNVTVSTGTGVLTLTGFAPQVNQKINTETGQLVITGFAPTILTPVLVVTDTGQLVITGFAPNVGGGTTASTGTGQLTLTGFAPTVTATDHKTVLTNTGQLILTGFEPNVLTPVVVQTGTGLLVLIGFAPTVTGDPTGDRIIIPVFFETDISKEIHFESDITLPVFFETDIIIDVTLK